MPEAHVAEILHTRDILPEVVREGNQPTSSNSWISGIRFIHPY